MLKDADIRAVLLRNLNEIYSEDEETVIINELGIDHGATRIDVAVVNGILHGFEIKSEADTLERLPHQMKYYNRLFERMTIVIDQRFLDSVKEIVPSWWGIQVVKRKKDGIVLVNKRKGRRQTSQDKDLLLKLLWKEDLERFIDYLSYPKKLKLLRKKEICNLILREVNIKTIRLFVYETLKRRNLQN